MSGIRATQRWMSGSPRWRRVGEAFDPDRYEVAAIAEAPVREFIAAHHYAPTLPSTTFRFGLFDHAAGTPKLVGVATLGVPMNKAVLTKPFPHLEPYSESLDFNRLVLLDSVPANGESWFTARALRLAADAGVRGVVTFSDPVPRWRTAGARPELVKPGHVGIVYQALNFSYTGRGTPRSLVLLPDATALTARALAKVTGREQGAQGVIARLVALGAPTPDETDSDQASRVWLERALRSVGARRVRHPGTHRYALRIGRTRAEKTRVVIGLPSGHYPKQQLSLTGVGDSPRCTPPASTAAAPVPVSGRSAQPA